MTKSAVADELAAMRKIVAILDKLEVDTRTRVLAWTYSQYAAGSGVDAPDGNHTPEAATDVREPVQFVNTLTVSTDDDNTSAL